MTESRLATTGNARRLGIEQLEERLLLAGNVALGIVAGPGPNLTVSLTGDAESNSISMTTTGSGATAELTIAALDGTQLTPGAINIPLPVLAGLIVNTDFDGVSATFITFNDVMVDAIAGSLPINTDVLITLGGGNDTLTVTNSEIGGDLAVDMGAGNDVLVISESQFIDGIVAVTLGDGDDQFVNQLNTYGDNMGPTEDVQFNFGPGNDYLVTAGNVYDSEVLIFDGGGGDDDVIVRLDSVGNADSFLNDTVPTLSNWELIDDNLFGPPVDPPFILPA